MRSLWWRSRVWVTTGRERKAVQWHSFASFCVLTLGLKQADFQTEEPHSRLHFHAHSKATHTCTHTHVHTESIHHKHHSVDCSWALQSFYFALMSWWSRPGGLYMCVCTVCFARKGGKKLLCCTDADTSHHHGAKSSQTPPGRAMLCYQLVFFVCSPCTVSNYEGRELTNKPSNNIKCIYSVLICEFWFWAKTRGGNASCSSGSAVDWRQKKTDFMAIQRERFQDYLPGEKSYYECIQQYQRAGNTGS